MAVVTPTAKAQFIDAAGIPLAGGYLYTYEAGTTTPQATYTDSTAATANSNPIVLDSRGEANIWLSSANYKFKLTDANGTEIWTVDNIAAPSTALSPVFSSNVTISANTSGPALLVTQTGAGAAIRVQDSADPDSSPFVVDTSGQVGIGTATPANAIDVAGGAIQISTSGGTARTVMSADSTDSIFSVNDDRNFTVKTNAATRLTVNSTAATTTVPVVLPGVPTSALQAATKSYVDTSMPPGALLAYASSSTPSGWLLCDGSAVSRTTYADLFAAISTTWGIGDGSSTFNVPDLRGQFLRGYDSRATSTSKDTTLISGITTNTSTTISGIADTTYLYVGMPISGTGIPTGATIATKSTNSITISSAATASSSTVGSGTTTNGSSTITMASTSTLSIGQAISGTGIPAGAYITNIFSSVVASISANATATNTGLTFTLGTAITVGRTFAGAQLDAYSNHNHGVNDPGHAHLYTGTPSGGSGVAGGSSYVVTTTNTSSVTTGLTVNNSYTGSSETRPKNYAVLYIIKT